MPGRSSKKTRPVQVQKASFWDQLPDSAKHALALLILLIVGLGFFWSVTLGGNSLIGGDTVQWRGMAEAMYSYEEYSGDRALWAPNGFSGMPGYLIHYPKEVWQVDRIPAFVRNLGWWPAAHFLVLLAGMYALVFFLIKDPLPSVLSAVAFGLTTYIPLILTAGHNTKFVSLSFVPLLVLAFLFTLLRPPRSGWLRVSVGGFAFAIALAINLRADHVQITYYVVMALAVIWIVEAVALIQRGRTKMLAMSTLALAIGGIIGVAMVAQPYMAMAEYRALTIRGAGETGGLAWSYAMNWSQGFGELVTLIIPNAYGSTGMTYWGAKPFTAGPHYIGIIVALLAGIALFAVRKKTIIGMGIAAFTMILFSLGENLTWLNRLMFNHVPLFSSFRVPETWLIVVALMTAILAGIGLWYLVRKEVRPEEEVHRFKVATRGLMIAGGLLVVLLVGRGMFFSFEAPGELQQIAAAYSAQSGIPESDPQIIQAANRYLAETKTERQEMFTLDALRAILLLALAAGLIVLYLKKKIPAVALQIGLVLLVVADLWQVDRRYLNEDNPAIRRSADISRAIPEYGFDRFVLAQQQVAGGPGHFRTLPLALNAFSDGRTPYFYESIGGYHAAKLALYQDYIDDMLFSPDGGFTPNGLELTATRFIIWRDSIPGFNTAFHDTQTGMYVLEHPDPMPRAWLVDSFEVTADRDDTYGYLLDPAFDIRDRVVLAEEPVFPESHTTVPDSSIAEVRLIRFNPREILWSVTTDQPRVFVASEVYYPAGWVARKNDREVPIIRANHLLRAVAVPAGTHHITMRFEPETHERSVLISLIATAVAYLGFLIAVGFWWYRRGQPTAD